MKSTVVYVLDDSQIICDLLYNMLSNQEGVTASTFKNGIELLESLSTLKPDIVFLDYYLNEKPGYPSGPNVLRELKKQYPDLPVVMMTGLTDRKKITELQSIGFTDFIHKDNDDILTDILLALSKYTSF